MKCKQSKCIHHITDQEDQSLGLCNFNGEHTLSECGLCEQMELIPETVPSEEYKEYLEEFNKAEVNHESDHDKEYELTR